jgi:hypothetical protein
MKRITSQWSLLSSFILGLCSSASVLAALPSEHHEKLAARLQLLLTRYLSMWKALPLQGTADSATHAQLCTALLSMLTSTTTTASTATATSSSAMAVSSESDDGSSNNGSSTGSVNGSVNGSLNGSGGASPAAAPPMHWRYVLMTSWCLMHLLRPGMSNGQGPSVGIWQWFIRGLDCGDGQPLQRLCLGAIARLLGCRSVQQRQLTLDATIARYAIKCIYTTEFAGAAVGVVHGLLR